MKRLILASLLTTSLWAQTTEMGIWIRYRHHLSYAIEIHIEYHLEE